MIGVKDADFVNLTHKLLVQHESVEGTGTRKIKREIDKLLEWRMVRRKQL